MLAGASTSARARRPVPGGAGKLLKSRNIGAAIGLLVVALTAGGLAGWLGQKPKARPKNLVLVTIDTLRRDRVSAYGYWRQTTPFLDQLAREGARADGVSPTPWTKAATATLLTGLHPLRHQTFSESDVIPAEAATLAEELAAAGFDTLGVSSNGWVSRAWGFERGFRDFVSVWRLGYGKFPTSAQVNQELIPRLAALREPYFLYVHYLDPHMPYSPPYGWDGNPLPPELARHVPFRPEDFKVRGVLLPLPDKLAIASELYDGEVRANDDALRQLFAALRARGLLEGTLAVVTSDHGEEFGEHGRVGHGQALYEESVAVPLVFHAPGVIRPQGQVGELGLEDVVPTVLDLLGVAQRRRGTALPFDGISAAAELRSGAAVAPGRGRLLHVDFRWGAALALVRDRVKLMLAERPAYAKALYDLRADPGEKTNLVGAVGTPVAGGFEALARELAGRYAALLRLALPRKTTSADAELVEQIKALGYLQAFPDRSPKRSFPRRLETATAEPGGLRGWEDLSSPRACFGLADAPSGQLLQGWHAVEPALGGRWSYPEATVWLPAPHGQGMLRLTLEGENYAPMDRVLHAVLGDPRGAPDRSAAIARGAFRVELPLDSGSDAASALLLRLRVEPPYFPPDFGIEDHRPLGLFLRRLCLERAPSD